MKPSDPPPPHGLAAATEGGAAAGALPVQRGRRQVGTWLRSSDTGLLLVSLIIGAGAGLGAVVFRWLITVFTKILSGHRDYAATPHAPHPWFPALGIYFVIGAPVLAGLVYGPLVYFFAREARGHGVPEVMYAVSQRGGRIAPKVAVVKALASALCIGGGGSVGREGPIVQIGSALGSTLGSLVRLNEERMRVAVACGAAGGIAATFNAPLAGVFFAMELILSDFAARSFGMVVVSSVTASVIARGVLGNHPFLRLPPFEVAHLWEYLPFAALGLLAGAVGVVFTRVLYAVEDGCDTVWRGPEWARPAAGGLLLGLLLLAVPQMYGVGYPVLGNGVAGKYAIGFLLLLLVAKMAATSLTIGIGGSGGVFAPSLFIGAMFGAAFGQTLAHLTPSLSGQAGAFGLIGMGAVFAGAARAPITAVVIMFELTGEYSIILPLMIAIVLATGVSNLLTGDTIYTLKLRRRGIDLTSPTSTTAHALTTPVSAMMGPVPPPLPQDMPLLHAVTRLHDTPDAILPVVDAVGAYRGVATGRMVAEVLTTERGEERTVGDATDTPPTVRSTQTLEAVIDLLDHLGTPAVPVLDDQGRHLVGWLTAARVLGVLRPGHPT